MPRKTNTPTPVPFDRVSAVADAYVSAIVTHCESKKLPVRNAMTALLKRPKAVRVAKVASFEISGTKVSDLLDTEELYYATNKIYSQFRRQAEVDVLGVTNDELLNKLKS